MREKVKLLVERKIEEVKRKVNSMEEAVSNIEDLAMDLSGHSSDTYRKHGRNLLKVVNKVHASDMDPEMVYELAMETKKALKDTQEMSLFPSYAYIRHVLEGGFDQ